MTSPLSADIDPATGLRVGTFAVGTFESAGPSFPGLVHPDGSVADLSDRFHDTHDIFNDWTTNFQILGDIATDTGRATLQVENLRSRPPLAHPNMIMAGANYKTHVAQMMTKNKFNQHNRLPDETDEAFFQRNYEAMEERGRSGVPFFWTGLHSALVGANDDIVLPLLGEQPDWELELGVIIGGTGRYLTPEEAPPLIAGYTMVNDLGNVDIFRRTDVNWGYDWVSKNNPTYKPAGPFIVPAPFITIDDSVRVSLSVNGQTMQDWPVNDFVFTPEQYISYASERIRLMPGDLLCMGSPPGNGAHHGRFLHDGDVIDSGITYLGYQHNRVVAEETHGRTTHFGLFASS